jgi:hypothetical protein
VQFVGDEDGDFGTVRARNETGHYRVDWDDGDPLANETWWLPGELRARSDQAGTPLIETSVTSTEAVTEAGTGDTVRPGDVRERAARVIEDATGLRGGAWTATTDAESADEIAEKLAAAGLLAARPDTPTEPAPALEVPADAPTHVARQEPGQDDGDTADWQPRVWNEGAPAPESSARFRDHFGREWSPEPGYQCYGEPGWNLGGTGHVSLWSDILADYAPLTEVRPAAEAKGQDTDPRVWRAARNGTLYREGSTGIEAKSKGYRWGTTVWTSLTEVEQALGPLTEVRPAAGEGTNRG